MNMMMKINWILTATETIWDQFNLRNIEVWLVLRVATRQDDMSQIEIKLNQLKIRVMLNMY